MKIKSKIIKTLLAASCAFALSNQAMAAAPSDIKEIKTIQDNGVFRVGVKNDVVGVSVKDPLTGEYKGFEDT